MGAALLLAALAACSMLFVNFSSAQQVLGGRTFLSLDCGGSSTEVLLDESVPDIRWQSDVQFIPTGSVATVASTAGVPIQLQSLRFFPSGSSRIKNCYSLPVTPGNQHLIRAGFLYGNYDGLQSPTIQFQIAVDNTVSDNLTISGSSPKVAYSEIIIAPAGGNSVLVCLIRTGNDASFINSLEVRELNVGGYNLRIEGDIGSRTNLLLASRINFGGGLSSVRYPDDPFDRIWPSDTEVIPGLKGTVLSAPAGQKINTTNTDEIPDAVMRTTFSAPNITYTRDILPGQFIYGYSFWAEPNGSVAPNSRIMDASDNFGRGLTIPPSRMLPFRGFGYGYNYSFVGNASSYTITYLRNANSILDPIVSADELYYAVLEVTGTDPTEVAALARLKTLYNLTLGMGDPCKPVAWEELTCQDDNDLSHVNSLDLSGRGLGGTIPADVIITFSYLEKLTLRNNAFSGSIPYNIQTLKSLKVLDLANNNLTGSLGIWMQSLVTLDVSNNQLDGYFPSTLLNNSLGFRYSGNLLLQCYSVGNVPCPQPPVNTPPAANLTPPAATGSNSSIAPIVGGIGAAVLTVAIIAGVALWLYRRHKLAKLVSGARKFDGRKTHSITQEAVRVATKDYSRQIGRGGFGPVYYGEIEGQEVAVKILDQTKSDQGPAEFYNEVVLLSTIHHKSLVSLVGYCHDPPDMILLYEFMSGGDLCKRLKGSKASPPLSWLQRLNIALDAARGLGYLHDGCTPAIIHRDIKSSNILLSHRLEAKLADFGISKLKQKDPGSQAFTRVVGTPGYMDPEYRRTRILTVESDIYSFGVVLLEILSGKPVHSAEGYIVHQAQNAVATGTVDSLVDPALDRNYSAESAWLLTDIALACTQLTGAARPKISDVVTEIANLVENEQPSRDTSSTNSSRQTQDGAPAWFNVSNYGFTP